MNNRNQVISCSELTTSDFISEVSVPTTVDAITHFRSVDTSEVGAHKLSRATGRERCNQNDAAFIWVCACVCACMRVWVHACVRLCTSICQIKVEIIALSTWELRCRVLTLSLTYYGCYKFVNKWNYWTILRFQDYSPRELRNIFWAKV